MDRDHFPNTNFPPAMTWQSLPPVPEQSLDCFLNPNYPIEPQFLKENIPNFGKSIINPNFTAVSADPGFAERAARFSPFGSRSFSARTSPLGQNSTELQQVKSNCVLGNLKLARVSSTPSLRSNCSLSQVEIRPTVGSSTSPNEGSSVSEQIPILETEAKNPSDSSFRKRKSVSKGKTQKAEENQQDDRDTKRSTTSENKQNGNDGGQKDEKQNEKQDEANTKAPEPPKDYIHVRARRGQATDSHSLAERVRREKISERMKLLQDLVPGCNKVTGKALMLDEIINYVQSLQRQVEFLSMKLASVNPLDFNTDSLLSEDVTNSTYPLESSSLFGQQKKDIHPAKTDFLNGPITHCSLDPSVETTMFRDIGLQLPFVDEFGQGFPQFSGSFEDDLQTIVQMGFGQNSSIKSGFHSQNFPGSSDTTNMSIEL